MPEIVFLYVTAPDMETAQRIANALVDARLAACVNIIPGMQSTYRWKGAIETATEVVAIAKTTAAQADPARALILQLHPYETPCIVSLPAGGPGSNPAYLSWIEQEAAAHTG